MRLKLESLLFSPEAVLKSLQTVGAAAADGFSADLNPMQRRESRVDLFHFSVQISPESPRGTLRSPDPPNSQTFTRKKNCRRNLMTSKNSEEVFFFLTA